MPGAQKKSLDTPDEQFRAEGLTADIVQIGEASVSRNVFLSGAHCALAARAIEHRLYEQTWLRADYDLLPMLRTHPVPTLVIHGDKDFVPVEVASHIAEAIPDAQLSVLPDCGHFAYLEYPDLVQGQITAFLNGGRVDPS